MNSIKKQARVAGFLYLLACLPAPFALIYVPNTLIVPGNLLLSSFRATFPTTRSTGTRVPAMTGFPNRTFSSTTILGAISVISSSAGHQEPGRPEAM